MILVMCSFVSFLYANDEIEEEEYKVYSEIIKQVIEPRGSEYLVAVESQTKVVPFPWEQRPLREYLLEKFVASDENSVTKEMLERFVGRNLKSYNLEHKFSHDLHISLISREELRDIFKNNDGGVAGWPEFYKRYPNAEGIGIITLSRVAFNDDKNIAFVFILQSYGNVGADAEFSLLKKENGSWMIIKSFFDWCS